MWPRQLKVCQFVLVLLSVTWSLKASANINECLDLIRIRVTPTNGFIAYLDDLRSEGVIDLEDLESLLEGVVKEQKIINVFENRRTLVERIHGDGLKLFIEREDINFWALEAWLIERILEGKEQKLSREQQKEKTRSVYKPLVFYSIKGGTFRMGDLEGKETREQFRIQEVSLDDFEMMATKVTVYQYTQLMGNSQAFESQEMLNPEDIMSVFSHGEYVTMAPDTPKDRVSWFEAMEYANRLSVLHGLEPVYKSEYLKDKNGRVRLTMSLRHPEKSVYETEGYRLPTQAEQEFVRRNRGAARGKHFFNNDDQELKKYIYRYEVPYRNYAVDLGEALKIDGYPFWGLFGPIGEWSLDGLGHYNEFDADKPRLGEDSKIGAFRGQGLSAFMTTTLGQEYRDHRVGFRLVRSLKGHKPQRENN